MAKSKKEQLLLLLKPEVEALDYQCVDVEFEKTGADWILTVTIDHENGIGLDDCELVSHRLSDVLDETDPIEQSYLLEVSSPGIDRPFKKIEDYQAAVGEMIDVHLFAPVEKRKDWTGLLKTVDAEKIVLECESDEDLILAYQDIAKAAPHIDF